MCDYKLFLKDSCLKLLQCIDEYHKVSCIAGKLNGAIDGNFDSANEFVVMFERLGSNRGANESNRERKCCLHANYA